MRLDGMDELQDALSRGADIDRPVREIVKRRTSEMNRKAQRFAPVATGDLRRSILSTYENNGLTGITRAGMNYAPYVEYGTRYMSAKPFLRPAFYEVVWSFREDLERLVR